jgi:hypothetical protein
MKTLKFFKNVSLKERELFLSVSHLLQTKCIIVLFIFFCYSCTTDINTNHELEVIDTKSKIKCGASELFEQFKVVPLETTDSSLIGLFIVRLEIWDDKMFILNIMPSHKNILCFDLSGKFLFKIDKMGQGSGEYSYLGDFFIDKFLDHVVIIAEPYRFLHFDMHGNYLYDIHTDDFYYARHTVYLNDSTYLTFKDVSVPPFENISLLYLDSKTLNVRDKSNKVNEYFNMGNHPLGIWNDRVLFVACSDSIYDISDMSNIHPVYLVYCTDKHAGAKVRFRNLKDKLSHEERLRFMDEYYYQGESIIASSIQENSKYIALTCLKAIKNTDDSKEYVLFYDKANKKTYSSENISFDEFNLSDFRSLYSFDDSFYCILNSGISENDKKKIEKSTVFSEEDKQKLINNKAEDNPLLFILK